MRHWLTPVITTLSSLSLAPLLVTVSRAEDSYSFEKQLSKSCAGIDEAIEAKASVETKQILDKERKQSHFRRFGHTLPPAPSGLDKYNFGRQFTLEEKWRHRVYSLGLMKILYNEFNGNKCGPTGSYPQRKQQRNAASGLYIDESMKDVDYKGHNIAAIAVNELGHVIISAFNHNKIFGSTAEHAEMRLMDECFRSPALHFQRHLVANDTSSSNFEVEDKMSQVTIYTTLEPCQQCSGRLLIAGVPEVVYCQRDPDIALQALATYRKNFKTRPVPANLFDLQAYDSFQDEYYKLLREGRFGKESFWLPPPGSSLKGKKYGNSMPYFLCTDAAKGIISNAAYEFDCLFTDDDEQFNALSDDEKDRVLKFRPDVNAACMRNVENELWQTRIDLLNFSAEQSKEIALYDLPLSWRENELSEALAEIGGVDQLISVNVMRLAGGKGSSAGHAYITFATDTAVVRAGQALQEKGWDAKPAVNLPKLNGLLRRVADLEKKMGEMQERAQAQKVGTLSNEECLQHMREYVEYERKCEKRGTMHR